MALRVQNYFGCFSLSVPENGDAELDEVITVTVTEEDVSSFPMNDDTEEIYISPSIAWSRGSLLKFVDRLGTLKNLESMEFTISEDLLRFEPIKQALTSLLITIPQDLTLVLNLAETPFELLPLVGRALSRGSNIKSVCLHGILSHAQTSGFPGLQTLLESVERIVFSTLIVDSTSFSDLFRAMKSATKLPDSMEFSFITRTDEADPAFTNQTWLSNQQTEQTTSTNKSIGCLDIRHCSDDFLEAFGTIFPDGNVITERLNIGFQDVVHRSWRPILRATKMLCLIYTRNQDLRISSEALPDNSSNLETLEVRYRDDTIDGRKVTIRPMMEAIQILFSRGLLKHLICPVYAFRDVALEGSWTQLHGLEVYGGLGAEKFTDAEVSAVTASLHALTTTSNTLVKLKTSGGFRVSADEAPKLQQSLVQNIIGFSELGPAGNVDFRTVIAVLDRLRNVDESHVAGIRAPSAPWDVLETLELLEGVDEYYVARLRQGGLPVDVLQTAVTYDAVRLALPPNAETVNECIKHKLEAIKSFFESLIV